MKPISTLATLMAVAALLFTTPAPAADFCASNTAQLQSQLDVAASNGEADTIRIAAGTYPVPSNGDFWYDARQAGDDDFDLTISGGWTEFFGNPCGQNLDASPLQTVLDGGDEKRIMTFHIRDNTSLTVRGLTFRNGQASGDDGGGLSISVVHDVEGGYTGRILVERNVFLNNEADFGGALYIGGPARTAYTAIRTATSVSRMGVVNNVFYANHAVRYGAAYLIQGGFDGGALGVGIYATNNTVLNNTQSASNFGLFGIAGDTPNVYVINNNMWGNDAADLYVAHLFETYRLQNNNIGFRAGMSPTLESGNISIEPEYLPCSGICIPFVLPVPLSNSPLTDAGIHPPGISPFWSMPTLDAAGNPRVAQGTVDIGAYENHERLFVDRFESSN